MPKSFSFHPFSDGNLIIEVTADNVTREAYLQQECANLLQTPQLGTQRRLGGQPGKWHSDQRVALADGLFGRMWSGQKKGQSEKPTGPTVNGRVLRHSIHQKYALFLRRAITRPTSPRPANAKVPGSGIGAFAK